MRVLKNKSAIYNLISKCSEALLGATIHIGKEHLSSYFISFEKEKHLIFIHQPEKGKQLKSGMKINIRFSMVYGGVLHDFKLESTVINVTEFKNFPAVFVNYPDKIWEEKEISDFRITLPEKKPARLNVYVDSELYPQNILKIGIQDIQFHFKTEGKARKNVVYIGKKFDDCELIIHDFTIHLQIQVIAFEAGTVVARMSSIDEMGMPLLKQFVQEVYIEYSEKDRFGWDSLNNLPYHEQFLTKKNKILLIESEKLFHLAVRELLIRHGYIVASIIEKSNVLKIATQFKPDVLLMNIDLGWDNGLEIFREIQKNRITKNIPVIFIADHHTDYDLKQVIAKGGVELLKKPLTSEVILEKVGSGILLKTQETREAAIKILLLGQDNRRAAFLLSEWAGKKKYQIIYGTRLKDLVREAIQNKVHAVFINSKGPLDKYILDNCSSLHELDMGENTPVFIFNRQVFQGKIVKIKKMLFGLEAYNDKAFKFVETIIQKGIEK